MSLFNCIPVSSDKTSYSSSRDSMGNTMKTASGNYCKTFIAIQRSDQKLWPFSTVFRSGATRPPIHRVGIPLVIQGKRPPETSVKLSWRTNCRIKSYGPFQLYSGVERQDLLLIEQGFHWNTSKTASGNYCKTFMAIQRSDQKVWPFSIFIPVWTDKTSYSSRRDSIGNTRKTASGNQCKTFMAIQRSDQKL